MKRTLIRLALSAAVIVPLSACSDKEDFNPIDTSPPLPPVVVVPPPPPATTIDSFGAGFASIFRAGADTEPRDPGEGDIVPISFTTEPGDPIGI